MSKSPLTIILNSINLKVEKLDREYIEKEYVPFVINKTMSYFLDTVLYAEEMNNHPNTDKYSQYLFYFNGVRKGKRFAKWQKADWSKYKETLDLIKEYYNYSDERALEALALLTDDNIKIIKERMFKGGKNE